MIAPRCLTTAPAAGGAGRRDAAHVAAPFSMVTASHPGSLSGMNDMHEKPQARLAMRVRDLFRLAVATLMALLIASMVAGCDASARAVDDVRGSGLPAARLDPSVSAAAYGAALREAFDVDSALMILVDPAYLPRDGSFKRDETMSEALVQALVADGVVRGSCAPVRPNRKRGPQCPASAPGYVVRFSEIYRMPGDSARLFLAADRFQTTSGIGPSGPFSFETGFQLLREGQRWTVVREGRRLKR